ncbi:MAG: hypothetical protein HOM52_08910 [Rhodospirillaceae bacterium]|jgi:hypothetical protein|nr:hypothetical protein [Rhodospirillaceae bacterium]MBT3926239.1 hypothetical protein [Rhodospirillaceae bacterium]MBT5038618.1 hypothetical protein [Rhodospirillaceae bacterium]MBT5677325.1 hypothetical protein [Rhodospirillaceae bacterium]MBT5778647.1 hypothetical protein [Rhodospirillaceae bacterium]
MARDVAFEGLLSAADRFCATRANTGCAAAGLFAEIVGNARAAPANPEPPQPRQLPACRHLATALSLGQSGSAADLAAAAAAIAERLNWVQNPNYVADEKMRAFVADYAYAELAGPSGMALCTDVALGLLLIGPDKFYPPHSHPAEEIYLVVAGEAEWQRANEPWQSHPPAAFIRHGPNVTHAMRTLEQPLLALYAWRGEIATAARLV